MVDFGSNLRNNRTIAELFTKYFRPGDIYTHMYGGVRGEQDPNTKGPSQAFIDGRKKGVILDVGHGGGSFRWSAAVPMMKAGFTPDSISTDLHASSMNAGMKNQLDVMSKFLLMGETLEDVVLQSFRTRPRRFISIRLATCRSARPPTSPCCVDKSKFGSRSDRSPRRGDAAATCEGTCATEGRVAT